MRDAFFTICFFLALFISPITLPDSHGTVVAHVVRVVDGDTIVAHIPSYPPLFGENIHVRLAGCDTPELRDKRPPIRSLAQEAKQFTTDFLSPTEKITLYNIKRGKYFRLIARVTSQGKDLSEALLTHGLALPYEGGPNPWKKYVVSKK